MDCWKLIELLNEYDEWRNWKKLHWKGLWCEDHDTIWYKDKELSCEQDEIIAYLISKKYGFIKWLVDNDKIDIEKIENSEYYLIDWFYYNERKKFWMEWKEDVEKIFLMLLSISDTPIDDLISYLK